MASHGWLSASSAHRAALARIALSSNIFYRSLLKAQVKINMRRYLKTKGLAGIARYSRTITTLSALAVVIVAVTIAHAQFRPIPNYIGIGAGLQFRNDINSHFSGAAPIAPRIVSLPFAQLPAEQEGQEYWCSDCQPTKPCLGVGSGALALGNLCTSVPVLV